MSDRDLPRPAPGDQVGPFQVVKELAAGAAGEVYLARDASGQQVALKLLAGGAAPLDPRSKKRFEREGELLVRLQHENVIRLHARGHDALGRMFLALELVEGVDLAALLEEVGKLSPRRGAHVIGGVAGALGAAHALGIVHRDLKASNVLVTPTGVVKLADFGLALSRDVARVTARDEIPGTLPYMAPEILASSDWSPASDLYALGVLAHKCLTGSFPFEERQTPKLIEAHLCRPPPDPARTDPQLPAALGQLVQQLLAKDPGRRPVGSVVLERLRAIDYGASPDDRGSPWVASL